jgi:hypothetical protein
MVSNDRGEATSPLQKNRYLWGHRRKTSKLNHYRLLTMMALNVYPLFDECIYQRGDYGSARA